MRVLGPEEREEAAGAEDAEGMVGGEGAGTGPAVAGAAAAAERFGAILVSSLFFSFSGRMGIEVGVVGLKVRKRMGEGESGGIVTQAGLSGGGYAVSRDL